MKMKRRSEELKAGIPAFVEEYLIQNRISPSVEDVAVHFNASKATIHSYLLKLDAEGVLKYRGRIGIPMTMGLRRSRQ